MEIKFSYESRFSVREVNLNSLQQYQLNGIKPILVLLIALFIFHVNSFGQSKASYYEELKQQIIVSERAGWQTWKNKDVEWFKINTTKEFLSISKDGISNKAEVVKSTATDCDVKSIALAEFTFVVLNTEIVVLTYIASQEGSCGNSRLVAKVRASATYIKQGGKWLEAYYTESIVSK